ncbi:hypothetical protein LCGC14_2202860, partial [marine sediment metagenome]
LWSVTDASGNNLFKIRYTGHTESVEGVRTATSQYGPGVWVQLYGENTPEHTNQTGSYDHTGGSSENLFTKTAGDDFTQADEDNGNWIHMTGANFGALAEIKEFLSSTTLVVDGMGWDGDLASQTFEIIKHPSFISGAEAKHDFSVESTGEVEVDSYAFTSGDMVHFKNRAGADDVNSLRIETIGNGFQDLDSLRVIYETGDMQPTDASDVIHITVDESGAVSADATTHINGLLIEKTSVNTLTSQAIHIGPGYTEALHVVGSPEADPDYGYEVTSTTVVDRVNSGGGGNDAFVNAAVDVQIFDNDNDYILIGSDNTFEIIEMVFATGGSRDSNLEFYFSIGGAGFSGWTQLTAFSESTNGAQNSGFLTFDAPGAWAKDDQAEVNADITNAYYIGVKRTRNGAYTTPTEDFFKIFANQAGGMNIRGDGVVTLPYLGAIPANPVNGMAWMEADGLHVYYNGAERTVTDAAP